MVLFVKDGALIARKRAEHGMSIEKLSSLVGASKSSISRLENGQHEVSPRIAKAMADAFGIDMMVLFYVGHRGGSQDA